MVRLGRHSFLLSLALAVSICVGSRARADLAIRLTEDPSAPGATNSTTKTFSFAGNGLSPATFSVLLSDFDVTSIGVTSNSGTNQSTAKLTVNVSALALVSGHTLEVDVSDNNFKFPIGTNYVLSNSASDTSSAGSADNHSYQSFATPGSTLFASSNGTPVITYGLGKASNGTTTTTKAFSTTQPYTLTSYTRFTRDSSTGAGLVNMTGSSIAAAAVPEPATPILIGLTIGLAALARWRSRRTR